MPRDAEADPGDLAPLDGHVFVEDDPATGIARRFVTTLIVACLLGAIGNVFMHLRGSESERAIRFHAGGELSLLVAAEGRSIAVAYLFPATLHDTIAGATLVVPDPEMVERFDVENLGRVDIEVADYEPEIDALAAGRFHGLGVVGEGAIHPDGEGGTFVIVSDPAPAGARYRLLVHGDTVFVVPEDMAPRAGS